MFQAQVTATTLQPFSSDDEPLMCSEGFFFDQNGTGFCRPECGEFRRTPLNLVIIERVFVSTSLVASVIMFIMASTFQRKRL